MKQAENSLFEIVGNFIPNYIFKSSFDIGDVHFVGVSKLFCVVSLIIYMSTS